MARSSVEEAEVRTLPGLSWSPVIAGVLLALAAHVVLGLVGAALGLSARPTDSSGLAVLAGFWGLVTPFVATVLGAWLACRLAAIGDVRATNLHGVMVWCIGIIAGALFLTGTTATGAMSASNAASGNAGFLSRATGAMRPMAAAPQGTADDEAARTAAKIAGGAAMAGLAGLLGAFAGAAIARSRREGKGIGWRVAIQRTAHPGGRGRDGGRTGEERPGYPDRAYPTAEERARGGERSEGPGAPPGDYHH
jgi:hypothetical protein